MLEICAYSYVIGSPFPTICSQIILQKFTWRIPQVTTKKLKKLKLLFKNFLFDNDNINPHMFIIVVIVFILPFFFIFHLSYLSFG